MFFLKFSLRNFFKKWQISFLLVLGAIIPSLLTVSSLSLNDSISSYRQSQVEINFGEADASIVNIRSSLFYSFPLSDLVLEGIESNENVRKILPVSESTGRIEKDGKFLETLVIAVKDKDLVEFVGKELDLTPGKAVIGYEIAHELGLKLGDNIIVHTSYGTKNFEVSYIDEKGGFLNYRGEITEYPGSIFVNIIDFEDSLLFPTKAYVDFVDSSEVNADKLSLPPNLKLNNIKENFMNSPTNQILGYIVFAFNSFSILAGIILIIVFGNNFANEQEKNIGILRILGVKRRNILFIFLLESILYFGISSAIGVFLGSKVGEFLLNQLGGILSGLSFETLGSFSIAPYKLTVRTVIFGFLIGTVIPLFIFMLKGLQISNNSPIESLKKGIEEYLPHNISGWFSLILILSGIFMFSFLEGFEIINTFLISLGFVFLFKNAFFNVSLSIFLIIMSRTVFSFDSQILTFNLIFQRALLFIFIVIIFFTSIIPILKKVSKLFSSKKSVSFLLGFSFLERFPVRILLLSMMFGIVIFGLIVIVSIPTNLIKFIDNTTQEGLFGFNFLVVSNPFKNLFLTQDLPVNEKINNPSKVQVAMLNSQVIAFVDDSFLEYSVIPSEVQKDWREDLKEKNTVIYGKFDEQEAIPKIVEGKISSFFPLSRDFNVSYKVVGFFDLDDTYIPIKYVTNVINKPNNLKGLDLLLGNVHEKDINEVKNMYMASFDFPIYIEELLSMIFFGVDNIVSLTTAMLYLGLISGFSGLALYSVRSCIVRQRMIGTLRAIGSSSKDIAKGFLIENFSIVSIGVLIGVFGGYFVARDIIYAIFQFLGNVDFYFPLVRVLGIIGTVYLITFLTLMIPVSLISKITPAESLKEIV